MSRLRCILVDDERLARVELRATLEELGGCEVVGEAAGAEPAVALIARCRPDLVFLDINMPGTDGFTLLGQLDDCPPVVFVTAYDEFAVRAFEVNALDYLLKPVDPQRLRQTLDRVRAGNPRAGGGRLFVPNRDGGRLVHLDEVYLLRAYDHYVRLYHGAGSDLLHRSLGALERRLDPDRYFRVNRSEIVRTDAIVEVAGLSRGRYRFSLTRGQAVTVSERRAVAWRRRDS